MSKETKKLSLNVQHDYITLRTPNGNYTRSFGGAKASGKLCDHFKKFENYIQDLIDNKGMNTGEAMNTLLDEKIVAGLFPEWDKEIPVLVKGDRVKLNGGFEKKYPSIYTVNSMKRKTCFIDLGHGEQIGIDAAFMEKMVKLNQ